MFQHRPNYLLVTVRGFRTCLNKQTGKSGAKTRPQKATRPPSSCCFEVWNYSLNLNDPVKMGFITQNQGVMTPFYRVMETPGSWVLTCKWEEKLLYAARDFRPPTHPQYKMLANPFSAIVLSTLLDKRVKKHQANFERTQPGLGHCHRVPGCYTANGHHICIYAHSHMGMCFFDVAVPGGWYKGYESQVWFGVWLGGMIRGMARAPLNSLLCGFGRWQLDSRENLDRLVATSQPGALVSGLN